MSWKDYSCLKIPVDSDILIKKKYSITADILSYQLCKRQYGFFAVRGYQPAHIVQYWFGTIIHQVLDKLHLHYKGLLDEKTKNQIPTSEDVEKYFNSVDDTLRARGIKAINKSIKETALGVLITFNELEGDILYPNVIDTECELQSDQGNFILHGVVDLLKENSSIKSSDKYESVEIWDYKGSKFPNLQTKNGKKSLERYEFQMLVYAELYKLKNGRYPLKGKLYFMNELYQKRVKKTPKDAIYEIKFNEKNIRDQIVSALGNFSQTVSEIQTNTEYDSWDAPKEKPDNETCDICDLRWNCAAVRKLYPMRYP